MRKPACRRMRSTSGGSAPASRIGSDCGQPPPIGSLKRAFQHHLDEEQDDEVEEERRDHLVDAEPHLEEGRPEHQQAAASAAATRTSARGRRAAPHRAGPDRDGGERAGVELALGADVVEPRPEGDGGGEAR